MSLLILYPLVMAALGLLLHREFKRLERERYLKWLMTSDALEARLYRMRIQMEIVSRHFAGALEPAIRSAAVALAKLGEALREADKR